MAPLSSVRINSFHYFCFMFSQTNLKTRSLHPTATRGGSGAQLGGGKKRRRVPQKRVPTAPPGMSTRLQNVSQGGNAKSKVRKNILGVRSGGIASKGKNLKTKKGFALSNQPKYVCILIKSCIIFNVDYVLCVDNNVGEVRT